MLYFETLDYKKQCAGFYADGTIFKSLPESESLRTWKPYQSLKGLPQTIEYAWLLSGGLSPDECVPEALIPEWNKTVAQLQVHLKAIQNARVPLHDVCLYDVLPLELYVRYFELLSSVTRSAFETYEKPDNHDFLLRLHWLLSDIESRKLRLTTKNLNFASRDVSLAKVKTLLSTTYVKYDLFGARTGRLGTLEHSFPILNLPRRYRALVEPTNDWYVEFDQNAADLRALAGILKREQPTEDLHEWNVEHVFANKLSRDEAKRRVFAWLYDNNKQDVELSRVYNKQEILSLIYSDGFVRTPFGRKVSADTEHALNYAAQSTAADVFYDRVLAVEALLKQRSAKSHIAFLMHDAIVLDFAESDGNALLIECKEVFEDTIFGQYKVNVSAGNNYGEMRKL